MTDHIQEFYALATAQTGRIEGRPSGDRVLDGMPLIHPTGELPLDPMLRGPSFEEILAIVLCDWWIGGEFGRGHAVRHRIRSWIRQGVLDRQMPDLVTLAQIGIVKLPATAPLLTVPWARVAPLLTVSRFGRSLAGYAERLTEVMSMSNANMVLRFLRPHLEDRVLDPQFLFIGNKSAAGIAWAVEGAPHGFHPARLNQDRIQNAAATLIAGAPEGWASDHPPWSIDAICMWAEFVWEYLKRRYPKLKDPQS